jgi:hypothetical protein
MKGKSYKAENRELAFRVYCECGGNVEMCLRELRKQGLSLSKPTIYDWMKKYSFEERRAAVDAEKQKAADAAQMSFEEQMLADLIRQKEKYESYFGSLGVGNIDNQAQFAYAGIIVKICDIRAKMKAHRASVFIEFMKDLINYLGKNDPDAVPVIERNLDDFVRYTKEKYAA